MVASHEEGLPKNCFVSWEIFIFKILGGGHSLSGMFLGEIIGFSRRVGRSAVFNWGIYGIMQSVNWAAYGTRLSDYRSGLVLNDFDRFCYRTLKHL